MTEEHKGMTRGQKLAARRKLRDENGKPLPTYDRFGSDSMRIVRAPEPLKSIEARRPKK